MAIATLSYQRTSETPCKPSPVPATAQASTASKETWTWWHLNNADGRKTLMTMAGLMHYSTGSRGSTDATVLDHDLEPVKKDWIGAIFPQIALAIGVLTSSWGVRVRRLCGFVTGGVTQGVTMSLEVSSGVCRGPGSQIQDQAVVTQGVIEAVI